ncbi:aminoglycoside phosphotransferase family protein [Microbulbifer guangxiensis]|uniref:aminoglycoside phosphotransferase family protein n=1 Tax=Microbulbifer guangxiensis TaxID=2904249 RepID=UPI001F164212|nr:aminoglycoside phosphotransferase family protein [Microbulbifer guangxiensis]
MIQLIAAEVLNAVYRASRVTESAGENTVGSSFYVIPGNEGPRWILPGTPAIGKAVISGWRPYGFYSKIKWQILRLAYSLGCLRYVPRVTVISVDGANLELPFIENKVSPVIYVGTPGRQQKAVVSLVCGQSNSVVAVLKVPLQLGAKDSIQREVSALRKLNLAGVQSVPKYIGSDKSQGWSLQSVLKGRVSGGKLRKSHVDFLLSLRTGLTRSLDSCIQEIDGYAPSSRCGLTDNQSQLVKIAFAAISDSADFPEVVFHGDFAPWNIKENGCELGVVDWEDSDANGFPFWDLCHFFFIQEFLLGLPDTVSELINNKLVDYYLGELGIDDLGRKQLLIAYILFNVCCANHGVTAEYRIFLINKMAAVLEL